MQSLEFFSIFIKPLEELDIPYFVTGSIAAIFYGEPRLTQNIDLVLHLPESDVPEFCALFSLEKFYCPPEEVIHIELKRRPHAHFNLIRKTPAGYQKHAGAAGR